jgi:hypothetical protein
MVIFLEYLKALNVLINLNILNNLKPLFNNVREGNIDIISTIAIIVNGYNIYDNLPLFNL